MNISKEERERIEDHLGNRWLYDGDYKRPESTRIDAAQMDVYTLLKALSAADEKIGELQAENERLRRYMDYEPKESKASESIGPGFFHVNGACYEVEMYESHDGYSAFTPQMRGVEGRGLRQFDAFYDLKDKVIVAVESE